MLNMREKQSLIRDTTEAMLGEPLEQLKTVISE